MKIFGLPASSVNSLDLENASACFDYIADNIVDLHFELTHESREATHFMTLPPVEEADNSSPVLKVLEINYKVDIRAIHVTSGSPESHAELFTALCSIASQKRLTAPDIKELCSIGVPRPQKMFPVMHRKSVDGVAIVYFAPRSHDATIALFMYKRFQSSRELLFCRPL